jgi:hypothetical protein
MDNMTRTFLTAVVVVAFSVGPVATASAQATRAEAEAEIRALQADIAKATKEIGDRKVGIFAADVAIAFAEAALAREQQKPNPNQGDVLALQIAVAVAKAGKNTLVSEKQDWERYQRGQEQALAQWEAYLRQLP